MNPDTDNADNGACAAGNGTSHPPAPRRESLYVIPGSSGPCDTTGRASIQRRSAGFLYLKWGLSLMSVVLTSTGLLILDPGLLYD